MHHRLAEKRILLLVADRTLMEQISAAMEALGAVLVRCSKADEMRIAIAGDRIDAAVIDLPVPGAATSEILGALAVESIPAIITTSSLKGVRAAATLKALGARAIVEKPFQMERLVDEAHSIFTRADPAAVDGKFAAGQEPLTPIAVAITSAPIPALEPDPASPERTSERIGLEMALPGVGNQRTVQFEPPPRPNGELSQSSVPQILATLHIGQATGALTVMRGAGKEDPRCRKGAAGLRRVKHRR